jgi:hypothetical protein
VAGELMVAVGALLPTVIATEAVPIRTNLQEKVGSRHDTGTRSRRRPATLKYRGLSCR